VHLVGLRLEPLHPARESVELVGAFDDLAAVRGREPPPRHVHRDHPLRAERRQRLAFVERSARRPRTDRALRQRLVLVRDHRVDVHLDRAPEAAARRTRAERRVEREEVRRRRAVLDVARRAVQRARELQRAAVLEPQRRAVASETQRLLRGAEYARTFDASGDEAVGDDVERKRRKGVGYRTDAFADVADDARPVDQAREARGAQTLGLLDEWQSPGRRQRKRQRDARSGGKRLDGVGEVARVLDGDDVAARPAVKRRRFGEEQLQVVRHLRHRADGRARRADGVRLLDGDRGRQVVDPVDGRPRHAFEELARVGGERLDVAAPSLGVERVEHQGGFAAS
jgi:hypothetical protein